MKQRNISEINEWRACAGACGDIGVGLLRGFLQTQCRIRARIKHRFIQVHIRRGKGSSGFICFSETEKYQ